MLKRALLYPLLSIGSLLILPASATAASALSISSPADGVYVLRGAGLEDVSGLEVSVSYEAATLANPRVQMGSLVNGMLSEVNPSNPVRLAMISANKTIRGAGTIATITFDRIGEAPGRITGLTGTLRDIKGQKVELSRGIVVDTVQMAQEQSYSEQNQEDPSISPPSPTGSYPYVGGTVTLPPDLAPPPDTTPPPDVSPAPDLMPVPDQEESQESPPQYETQEESYEPPPAQAERPQPPAGNKAGTLAVRSAANSVLERFRLYQGEKSAATLLSFFEPNPGAPFTQYPSVGIADGKETVSLVIWKVPAGTAPKFVFDSARFVSLATGESEWELEVKPEKGATSGSVKVLINQSWQEMPLTVAPRVDLPADFQVFLNDRGTGEAPKYDLNGDGRRDYVDDYIYAANFLVKQREKGKQDENKQ